jgi:hypothetical protein
MTRTILVAALAVFITGCTVVKINKDDTTTIRHQAGEGIGQDLANRACRRAGRQSAVIVSSVNKDAALPPGTGRQITTFRCV